jgi:hypothetical protein
MMGGAWLINVLVAEWIIRRGGKHGRAVVRRPVRVAVEAAS